MCACSRRGTLGVAGVELEVLDRNALVPGEYFGEESQSLSQSLLCLFFLGAWLQSTLRFRIILDAFNGQENTGDPLSHWL